MEVVDEVSSGIKGRVGSWFGVTGGQDQHSASTLCTVTAAWR